MLLPTRLGNYDLPINQEIRGYREVTFQTGAQGPVDLYSLCSILLDPDDIQRVMCESVLRE